MKTVTITLLREDAEPLLRVNAQRAAEYGALLDHTTRKTMNVRHRGMGESYDDARKRWMQEFLRSKRIVNAFGIEHDTVSESEMLTVGHRYVGGKTANTGLGFKYITGSKPDYKHPLPEMRGEIFIEACRQAADRTVRRWRNGS